jgi:4'-phosphopantetheinyl transferase
LLDANEIKRADAFHFEQHRLSFTVAHAAMRQILSAYVNVAPQNLVFVYGEQAKPELAAECGGDHVRFNLSHSGCFALLAVAEGFSLGIDIERVNAEFLGEDIAERFFSRTEVSAFRAIAADSRADAFFSCWTRKEAYIKALGGGLSIPLDTFDVAFGPGVPAALLRVSVVPDARRWSLYDVPAPQGYKAALVAESEKHRLRSLFF